jgi:endoglucanase
MNRISNVIGSGVAAVLSLALTGCGPGITDAKAMAESPEGATCGPTGLVEDGEDNNNQVIVQDGRAGYIYTYMDAEGTTITPKAGSEGGVFEMSPGGANGSSYALRMHGTIASGQIVFAGMGMNLTDPKDTYDGSRFKAVSFYAKKGAGSKSKVRFKIPDANTDPEGGVCSNCYNDFGLDIKLTEEWTQYTIPLKKLKQEAGWGAPRPGNVAVDKMYAIQFQNKEPGPYDVWVDEVRFTGCEGAAPAAAPAAAK